MIILKSHTVPADVKNIRLYDYAPAIFSSIPSRKGIKKAIKSGEIRVDGEVATTGMWVKPDQVITLVDLGLKPPKPYTLTLEVVYEDDDLAVINKPAGIVVSGNQYRTIQNALIGCLKPSSAEDALNWPRPVHRLDGPTSGLLLIAKTSRAIVSLGRQFEERKVFKKYLAIVVGKLDDAGDFSTLIDEQTAFTHYEPVKAVPSLKAKWLTLVALFPKTGRKHQLRIHLSAADLPILGDKLYGKQSFSWPNKGMFLCAVALTFTHPGTGKMQSIEINPPEKFDSLLNREARRWHKYNPTGS